jgi:o-succinylbenzoate synthase
MRTRIARIEVAVHEGSTSRPIQNARAAWRDRRGVRLSLFDESDRVGLGEASPLPGWSPDTFEAARDALLAFDVGRLGAFDLDRGIEEELARWSSTISSAIPSARFALETALLDLAGQAAKRPIHALLSPRQATALPIAALLESNDEKEAEAAIARGIRTLKKKMDGQRLDHDLDALITLRARLPKATSLRLDFNQSIADPASLFRLDRSMPELVEEPLPFDRLLRLERAPVPIALDESLAFDADEPRLTDLAERRMIAAIVLKPTMLGGFVRCLALARLAHRLGLGVVVTHLFDGPISYIAAIELAHAIGETRFAHGLSQHVGLDAWPAACLPAIERGEILPRSSAGLGLAFKTGEGDDAVDPRCRA